MEQVNQIFKHEYIKTNQRLHSKEEVLRYLAEWGSHMECITDVERVFQAFQEREMEFSTGFGDGFAIPHAKSEAVKAPTILLLKNREPIEWEAIDFKPVKVIFALLVPYEQRANTHLQLLARLSEQLMETQFKTDILTTDDIGLLYDRVQKIWREEV